MFDGKNGIINIRFDDVRRAKFKETVLFQNRYDIACANLKSVVPYLTGRRKLFVFATLLLML